MTSPELMPSSRPAAETEFELTAAVTTAGRPSLRLLKSRKRLCLDYSKTDLDVFIEWLRDVETQCLKEGIDLPMVVLMADYRKLEAGDAERCAEALWETYAMIADYPVGAETFDEAVKAFNDRLMARPPMRPLAAA